MSQTDPSSRRDPGSPSGEPVPADGVDTVVAGDPVEQSGDGPAVQQTEPQTEAQTGEKKVSWAELFFDLVFVVAVTRTSALIEHDHGWTGLLRALIAFVPIYWLWVGTAMLSNQSDPSRPTLRLRIFGVALAGVFAALALPQAYGRLALVFALAYWLGRIVLAGSMFVLMARGTRVAMNPYLVSVGLTGPMLVIGALLPDGHHALAQTILWGLAALIDLSTPTVLARQLSGMHVDAPHLSERFGLFVLIALGESVVAVATSNGEQLDAIGGLAVAVAFAVSVGLWWVYFHFAADAVRHALATAQVQLHITRTVLSYGHLLFIGSIIVVSVGLHEAIAHPAHHLPWAVMGLLYGGTAVYLATFGLTRWAMFRLVSVTRLSAAAVVVLLLPVASFVPALVALALLALVLAGLNGIELARVSRIGWRAVLRRRRVAGAGSPKP